MIRIITCLLVIIHLYKTIKMSKQLDELQAEVTESKEVMQSAKILIEGIAAKLAEAGTDQAKLDTLRSELDSSSSALAEAVAANTPNEDQEEA